MNGDSPLSRPLRRPIAEITQARIGIGRAGCGLTTSALLDFQLDHARARDAVHTELDIDTLLAAPAFDDAIVVDSEAPNRTAYLQDPSLGRRIDQRMADRLVPGHWNLAIVIGDGLSATAVHRHAPSTCGALVAALPGWRIAPPVLVRQARVAVADEIGAALGAELVVILLGERPGLSAADSLGAYLTYAPRVGRRDSERNCVSNIRPPHGLSYDQAARKLAWLLSEARSRHLSGVDLKDDSSAPSFLPSNSERIMK